MTKLRLFAVLFLITGVAHAATLHVAPSPQIRDEALTDFRVTGLAPHQRVTVRATTNDLPGSPWTSSSEFIADASGVVDLATQQPVAGSYSGKDVMGPVWSIASADAFALAFMLIGAFPMGDYTLTIEVVDASGNTVASTNIVRTTPGVTRELYSPNGYEIALYYPTSAPAKQTIVHVTGSGGGRLENFCEMLAARGHFAACVPYFGMPGTNPTLQEVPLEHFVEAIDAVLAHPRAAGTEVVFSGVSRGAEASLIVSSKFPDRIKAALAFMPGTHLWDAETTDFTAPPRAAWTLGGQPLPFLKIDYEHLFRFNPSFPWVATPTFRYSEATASVEERRAARIPVEQIDGPVFLASGVDDQLWPSDEYATRITADLAGTHRVVNVKGVRAGHLAFNPPYTPSPTTIALIYECGGTPDGTADANVVMWRELLQFLDSL